MVPDDANSMLYDEEARGAGEAAWYAPMPSGNNAETKLAIAPAAQVANDKFLGMLRRNSPDVAWKVAFKTMRRSRVGDARLPCGFPDLATFFLESRSLRVFKWGFCKYKEVFAGALAWKRWLTDATDVGDYDIQRLRLSIWNFSLSAQRGEVDPTKNYKPFVLSNVQKQIILFTLESGFWKGVDMTGAADTFRSIPNWKRARCALLAVRFVVRCRKLARPPEPCLSDAFSDAELFGESEAEDEARDCVSPSLKRMKV